MKPHLDLKNQFLERDGSPKEILHVIPKRKGRGTELILIFLTFLSQEDSGFPCDRNNYLLLNFNFVMP